MPSIIGFRQRAIGAAVAGAAAWLALAIAPSSVLGAPPPASFTPSVRADAAETKNPKQNQNEPQVTVDQAGTAYVTWQSGENGSDVSKTADGVHFSYLGYPDPSTPNSGLGTGDVGDVTFTHNSFAQPYLDGPNGPLGAAAVYWGNLGTGGGSCPGPIEIRNAATLDGSTWSRQATAGCQPAQIDRPWMAAYTPPQYRGTAQAANHTSVYYEYHDFGESNIWLQTSTDGGQTWAGTPNSAIQPGSAQELTSTCNTIPGGVAVNQNGPQHPGRIYAVWSTSDLHENAVQGCNYTQAEAFDHIFLSYSDDGGQTWTSSTVFNDACAPNPPAPPSNPSACQDVSELFTSIAVDDAGNVYVAYIARDISKSKPEYDAYVATSTDGGAHFTAHKANTDTGTHYEPWVAAAGDGGVDVAYYDTPAVVGAAQLNKPAAAPSTAQWTVQMSQSLDGGQTWTQSPVSDHPNYFGDICSTGIFCGNGAAFGWGDDRTLFDDFGVAVGPDGGARVAWTDAHDSWGGSCQPGGTVSCQSTHVDFACQASGAGLAGQVVDGCGRSTGGVPVANPATGGLGVVSGLPGLISRKGPALACASRRDFRIRLRVPRGQRLRSAKVYVNGRRVRVLRGRRLTATVDLRHLPRGRFTVRVVGVTSSGRVITETRRYRTCTPKGRKR
jgi:hypothetical protein